jgi:hypothetical protein
MKAMNAEVVDHDIRLVPHDASWFKLIVSPSGDDHSSFLQFKIFTAEAQRERKGKRKWLGVGFPFF